MAVASSTSNRSYLSPNVKQLLRTAVEPCRDANLNNQALQCLRTEGQVLILEDHPIQFLLDSVDITDLTIRNHQWYRVVLRRLSPLFNYCHDSLLKETFSDTLIEDATLFWLTQPALVFEAIEILARHDENYMPKEVIDALKEQGVYQEPAEG